VCYVIESYCVIALCPCFCPSLLLFRRIVSSPFSPPPLGLNRFPQSCLSFSPSSSSASPIASPLVLQWRSHRSFSPPLLSPLFPAPPPPPLTLLSSLFCTSSSFGDTTSRSFGDTTSRSFGDTTSRSFGDTTSSSFGDELTSKLQEDEQDERTGSGWKGEASRSGEGGARQVQREQRIDGCR
jgi:hypothetical protein